MRATQRLWIDPLRSWPPRKPETPEEWYEMRRQAKARHRDEEPDVLGPPEAFSDRRADESIRALYFPGHDPSAIRERSAIVEDRIRGSCAGWPGWPTPAEFYDAIHAPAPTPRHCSLIGMWVQEAGPDEMVQAWAEEVYTIRELVAAIHRTDNDHPYVARMLNPLARP